MKIRFNHHINIAVSMCVLCSVTMTGCNDEGSDDETATTSQNVALGSTNSTTSTAGVGCDYNYSAYNSSSSVEADSKASWTCSDTQRKLVANGIPNHSVGTFPNDANPNAISALTVDIGYTLTPTVAAMSTELGGSIGTLGYLLNGVKINPSTLGSCADNADTTDIAIGTPCSPDHANANWSIEALGQTSFDFGIDANNARVQLGGAYHYHGIPEGFVTSRGGDATKMTLIGWAADGFPIYARYGYTNANDATSALKVMEGSYKHINDADIPGTRPAKSVMPMGTFKQDWEYVVGSGDLDECNGRTGVTPEFPNGIYHYYATDTYPYLQRCLKGNL